MTGRVYTAMCLLAMLGHVNCLKLTKEMNIDELTKSQEPPSQQSLTEALETLKDTDIREQLVGWFFNSSGQVATLLQDFLSRSEHPQVQEVIDVFNAGVGKKLLLIEDDFIQIDPIAFERILSERAQSLSKALYPNNLFQQLVVLGMLQQRINELDSGIRPLMTENKVPIQVFSAILAGESSITQKTDTRSLVRTDIFTTICESFASTVYTYVNTTLTSYLTALDGISVSSSDNMVVNLIAAAITLVKDFAEELISTINEYTYELSTSICSSSTTTSRRRRDTDFDFARVKGNTGLSVLSERALATRSIWDTILSILWSAISPVMNSGLTELLDAFLTQLQSTVDDFLNDSLGEYLLSMIEAIFPS